jgi:hypothetical protein
MFNSVSRYTFYPKIVSRKIGGGSEIVEFTPDGRFIAQMQVDSVPGSAFGLAFGLSSSRQLQFAAVDDNTNTATIWTLRTGGNN